MPPPGGRGGILAGSMVGAALAKLTRSICPWERAGGAGEALLSAARIGATWLAHRGCASGVARFSGELHRLADQRMLIIHQPRDGLRLPEFGVLLHQLRRVKPNPPLRLAACFA